MKIAYLVDQIGLVTETGQLRDACAKVIGDSNYLQLKKGVNSVEEWYISYQRVSGTYPTESHFQDNADAAITEAERVLQRTGLQQAEELLRRLQEYRDTIPSLW